MPRVWTRKQLWQLAARREAGESTESIAASVRTTANNLRFRWRKHIGFSAKTLCARMSGVPARSMRVWGWLHAGATLSQCCLRLGWPADQRHLNRLSMSVRRYCARNGILLPRPVQEAHHGRKAAQQADSHPG
jgi:hypothetical protein